MKRKLIALVATAVAAVSLGIAAPTAGAQVQDSAGGCSYTLGWAVIGGIWYPITIAHC